MMRPLVFLVVLAMSAVTFAGCIGTDDAPQNDDDVKETGTVQGKVLTLELEPVEDAVVSLKREGMADQEAVTAADGAYTVQDVPPGKYKVQVASSCCGAAVRTLDVEAGELTQADFQVSRLTADDLKQPYRVSDAWEGFISCGVKTPVVGVALCGIPGIFHESLEDPNEDFLLTFNVTKGIKTLVVGMEWNAGGGGFTGDQFWLTVDDPGCGVKECTYRYASENGGSPLVMRIDNDDITEPEWTWDAITGDEERTIRMRVFAGGDTSVVYQQPFKIYYEAFYWEEAPERYDVLPDA